MNVRIRSYEPDDRNAYRGLWVELTEWHRELYESPTIGGDDPAAQVRGDRQLLVRPVARNEAAIRQCSGVSPEPGTSFVIASHRHSSSPEPKES